MIWQNKLDLMDLKQIIRLHHDGLSNRKIAKPLGIGRNTVNAYMQLFDACDRSLRELKELDDHQLQDVFPSHTVGVCSARQFIV